MNAKKDIIQRNRDGARVIDNALAELSEEAMASLKMMEGVLDDPISGKPFLIAAAAYRAEIERIVGIVAPNLISPNVIGFAATRAFMAMLQLEKPSEEP